MLCNALSLRSNLLYLLLMAGKAGIVENGGRDSRDKSMWVCFNRLKQKGHTGNEDSESNAVDG